MTANKSLSSKPLSSKPVQCPALVISAPNSGAGKTTVTAAMARYFTNLGNTVQVFKTGPDFIDPMILETASRRPVFQLDLWMVGEADCQRMLYEAAAQVDLILIEGVMGLFDGTPSTADLSRHFGIPVLAVIDGAAMAQTFGAVAFGMVNYQADLNVYGVLANKIASDRHGEMVMDAMTDVRLKKDFFKRNAEIKLAERHLGLTQASELENIDTLLDLAAEQFATSHFAEVPPAVEFVLSDAQQQDTKAYQTMAAEKPLTGKRIAVAKDVAFAFLYRANLALLSDAGAELVFVSPLNDSTLPDADALYIPGGYPELHGKTLSDNCAFIEAVKAFATSGKPLLAECGGMLYLLEQLNTQDGEFKLAGVLPGIAQMNNKLSKIGQQYVDLQPAFASILSESTVVRGHSFHYSCSDINLTPVAHSTFYPHEREAEAIYRQNAVLASYMHWYFPSNPAFFVRFFNGELV
jgi:cobyrinic acid a,c-diamide synthase